MQPTFFFGLFVSTLLMVSPGFAAGLPTGTWLVELNSPGGKLPFRMEVAQDDGGYRAWARNGSERLAFDSFRFESGKISFGIATYGSEFVADWDEATQTATGIWTKPSGKESFNRLAFVARPGPLPRFALETRDETRDLAGRWAVNFRDDDGNSSVAVAEFRQDGGLLLGTFLTPTGDYRFLEGVVDGNRLRLSCFDGGHAFLFHAQLGEDGKLRGDFWSADRWHESWEAHLDSKASLPDAFSLSKIQSTGDVFRFSFPDLDGKQLDQDDPSLAGKPRILVLFGSWCPNCNDEAPFLCELASRYQGKLEILGLAFEQTGVREKDLLSLQRFKKRHDINYRILLAGTRDKAEASKLLPDLEKVIAFPTTLFLDRKGRVVKIHTGFSGPGTGPHYKALRLEFEKLIESLLQ